MLLMICMYKTQIGTELKLVFCSNQVHLFYFKRLTSTKWRKYIHNDFNILRGTTGCETFSQRDPPRLHQSVKSSINLWYNSFLRFPDFLFWYMFSGTTFRDQETSYSLQHSLSLQSSQELNQVSHQSTKVPPFNSSQTPTYP